MGVQERALMTWDSSKKRWQKMHAGKWYKVSCFQLGCPPTKEASYRKANEWWRTKLVELEVDQSPRHPHQSILDHLERRSAWAREHGLEHVAEDAIAKSQIVESLYDNSTDDVRPFAEFGTGSLSSWSKAIGDDIPEENTLSGLSRRFLELSEARVVTGELSASEHDLATRCTGHFVAWAGVSSPPAWITPEKWEDYWKFLLRLVADGKRSREYVKKDWRYARLFIEWMASLGKLPVPPNLHNRRYKFGDTDSIIPNFSIKECNDLVEKATGQTKLHLLLMLNCGMYQGDISEMRHEEVDWTHGIITRQRSKVRKRHKSATKVSYNLWPITFELLREHRSSHPELALTTQQGKKWVEEVLDGARVKYRRDGIQSNFRHLQKALNITKPLKVFRKTSASLLDKHPEFGRYAQFFLAQRPRSIAERHYVVPNQAQFDRAIEYLRTEYGF